MSQPPGERPHPFDEPVEEGDMAEGVLDHAFQGAGNLRDGELGRIGR